MTDDNKQHLLRLRALLETASDRPTREALQTAIAALSPTSATAAREAGEESFVGGEFEVLNWWSTFHAVLSVSHAHDPAAGLAYAADTAWLAHGFIPHDYKGPRRREPHV